MSRLRASALRRAEGCDCPTCGQPLPETRALRLDPHTRTVVHGGTATRLTPHVFRILAALYDARPRVLSFDFLIAAVSDHDPGGGPSERTIYTQMCYVRRALEGSGWRLVNERGAGYRLAPPKLRGSDGG